MDEFIALWRADHGHDVVRLQDVGEAIRRWLTPPHLKGEARLAAAQMPVWERSRLPSPPPIDDALTAAQLRQFVGGMAADSSRFEALGVHRPGDLPFGFVLAAPGRFDRCEADPKAATSREWRDHFAKRVRRHLDAPEVCDMGWERRIPEAQGRAFRETLTRYAKAHGMDEAEAMKALHLAGVSPPPAATEARPWLA